MSRAPYLLFGARAGLEVRRPEGRRCDDPRRPVVRLRELAHGRGGRAHRREVRRVARRAGPLRRPEPAARRRRVGARRLRRRGRAGHGRQRRAKAKTVVSRDEGMRPDTTAEALAKLRAAFREGGTVTAGNASTLSDGAAAVVVGSRPRRRAAGRRSRWRGSSPTRRAAWRRRTSSSPRCWRCGRCWRRRSCG